MHKRDEVIHINLTEINNNVELSFLLHRLITHHTHLAWTLHFEAGKIYTVDQHSVTLSHHLVLTKIDPLEDKAFQLPQYAASVIPIALSENRQAIQNTNALFLYVSGLCYFQDKEKLLSGKDLSFTHDTEMALHNIIYILNIRNPHREYNGMQRVENDYFPPPHIREYASLLFINQKISRRFFASTLKSDPTEVEATISQIILFEDRIWHYVKMLELQKTWPLTIINPLEFKRDTADSGLLAEFLSLLNVNKAYRLSNEILFPFRGAQLKLTHRLIYRLTYRAEPAFDVLKAKSLDEGNYGVITSRATVLVLSQSKPGLRKQTPGTTHVYKEALPGLSTRDLDIEFSRTESISYLKACNNHHLFFSMRKLRGLNLERFLKSNRYQAFSKPDKIKFCLEFAYKSFLTLHRHIANNDKLEYCHGDIKPTNIILSPDLMTIYFIDFDQNSRTQRYYPPHFPRPSKALDCYSLIRVLARVFEDSHPIWKTQSSEAFARHHEKGDEGLLEFLFNDFHEAQQANFLSKETVMDLKAIFIQVHAYNKPNYPSAAQIAQEFQIIYYRHCEWLKMQTDMRVSL